MRLGSKDSGLFLLIESFIDSKAITSQSNYRNIIKQWISFLDTNGISTEQKIITAKPLDVERFVEHIKKKRGITTRNNKITTLSHNTIRIYLAILKSLYDYLATNGIRVAHNPFAPINRRISGKIHTQKRPTETVPMDKVIELINTPNPTTTKGIRDQAILAIMFGGGLRRSEVTKLRVSDVEILHNRAKLTLIKTKNGSDAIQIIPQWASEKLSVYYQHRVKEIDDLDCHLFTDYGSEYGHPSNKKLHDSTLYKRFKMYCKQVGLPSSISPHSSRATAITKLLTDGLDHRTVQEFSRHSSIQMVEAYDKRVFGDEDHPGNLLEFKPKK